MGITGEMVRSVFSKSRSVRTQEYQERVNAADKRKWVSVRSYLCGDELNSVFSEEDSASVSGSEATVTQPILQDGNVRSKEANEEIMQEKPNSMSKLMQKEDAAIVIQTAFRIFLARHPKEEPKPESIEGTPSPSKESIGTSIEVQTGNSVEVFSIQKENMAIHHRVQQKPRPQILKLKEDWDHSTVSSNISKLRIKNRLEATTRRERALAYAFAQQLRICSKKKQTRSEGIESNIGWSWLERWMATRLPESSSVEDHICSQIEPISCAQSHAVRKELFDVGGEEKESCGSNDVSVKIESFSAPVPTERDGSKPAKNKLKVTRSVSRRKTVPSYQYPKEYTKKLCYTTSLKRKRPSFYVYPQY
ncbi:protein IQ-DOMAIN 33 isoform X2 [Malania oleifera]|uniref:protein IQ-DOMAIN 33 isoform X2 n=1 Tax=Malania oleifera TaxID=397392 RepID=UPI0025ADC07A|nr:protein IQ-DOMAIN 33 isoform X2 [Malania oleifera]XP_057955292.1 protein IQ-DOMAIN 33 isoform X2 [Malania oleifera]